MTVSSHLQHQIVQEVKIEFAYLGDGYVENSNGVQEETCGMSLKVNDQVLVEVWARDAKDFVHLLSA